MRQVICNRTKECKDRHCMHKYAHVRIPFNSCEHHYCSVVDCNVECEETDHTSTIETIKDMFQTTRILKPA